MSVCIWEGCRINSDNYKIRKRTIKAWLEDYHAIVFGDRRGNFLPGNSGAAPYDGVNAGRLNKIMLQAAIKELPPILKKVVIAKWIKHAPLNLTLQQLGLSKDQYYKRCDWAIEYIYCCVNNDNILKSKLLLKVNRQQLTERAKL